MLNTELLPDNYVIFREGRNFATLNVTRGRGVLIAASNTMNCYQINLSLFANSSSIDILGLKVTVSQATIFHIFAYIPPATSFHDYELFLDMFNNLHDLMDKPNNRLSTKFFEFSHLFAL